MPGLTPNFAEFSLLNAPSGNNFLVGYDTSGSNYTRTSITGLANAPVFTNLSGTLASGIAATGAANAASITALSGLLTPVRTGALYGSFTPLVNQPPAFNFATIDTRNSIAVLSFDDTTPQSGIFVGSLPYSANVVGGLSVDVKWVSTGAGNCLWGARFMPLNGSTNLNNDNFAPPGTGVTTALSIGLTAVTSLLVTGLNGILAGDAYRLNFYRIANDVNDTLIGPSQVHSVTVRGV